MLGADAGRIRGRDQGAFRDRGGFGSVITLATYASAGEVDWKVGLSLAIGGLIGEVSGVRAAHSLPEKKPRLLFCGLLLVTAVMLLTH